MEEQQKPFVCTIPDCTMSFTNEDHLNVHTKKHDMVLQLGIEQKNAFVADQTPTPTRFIRNCEEVGLFQDLQNVTVNPFDEGFKRAIESKHHHLPLDTQCSTEELHTPQVFPLIDTDTTLFTDGHVTISRSSSEEGKHCEATLTKSNHVTINRVGNIEKINDVTIVKNTEVHTDTISYTNTVTIYNKEEIKNNQNQKVETEKDFNKDKPLMSQQSIDYFVDSIINENKDNDNNNKKKKTVKRKIIDNYEDYEVIIKLPSGKQMVMKAVEDVNVKDVLRKNLTNKIKNETQNVINNTPKPIPIQIPTGTLIPVTLITHDGKPLPKIPIINNDLKIPIINNDLKIPIINNDLKIPIINNIITPKIPLPNIKFRDKQPVIIKRIRKKTNIRNNQINNNKILIEKEVENLSKDTIEVHDLTKDDEIETRENTERGRFELESRSAASKRYRIKVRETMKHQALEIQQLKLANERLKSEKAVLKLLITEHLKKCPIADDLRATQEKIQQETRL